MIVSPVAAGRRRRVRLTRAAWGQAAVSSLFGGWEREGSLGEYGIDTLIWVWFFI